MKNKILSIAVLILFFSSKSFSQTTKAIPSGSDTTSTSRHNDLNNRKIYRATNGTKKSQVSNAGSATTYSPGASSQVKTSVHPAKKSTKKRMYRDTRLGSSEKKYDTYKKNDYGAGSVTTHPKN